MPAGRPRRRNRTAAAGEKWKTVGTSLQTRPDGAAEVLGVLTVRRMSFLLLGAAAKKWLCSADDGDELKNGRLLLLPAPAAMHFEFHVRVDEGRR